MGKQNNIVKFGVPGFFGCSGVPGYSGVFRSVPECFGVPGRFPFGQKFRKFRFGAKWKTFFSVRPTGKFPEKVELLKR